MFDLDREEQAVVRTIINTYIEDDGWNPPKEVFKEIEMRIVENRIHQYKELKKRYNEHKGKWLTMDVAVSYDTKTWIYRMVNDYQYIKEVRKYGEELRKEYDITELEAINIVLGHSWLYKDYVLKYDRIKNYEKCFETKVRKLDKRYIRQSYLTVKDRYENGIAV